VLCCDIGLYLAHCSAACRNRHLLHTCVKLNTISLRGIPQGANDEIFDSSNSPVLTGIDLDSTYIYLMQDMYDRKGETWEFIMETLKDKGDYIYPCDATMERLSVYLRRRGPVEKEQNDLSPV